MMRSPTLGSSIPHFRASLDFVNHPPFDGAARVRAMARSIPEGIAYAIMVGAGESFFIADALRLGASPFEVGMVIALPLLAASVGPLLVVRMLQRAVARRPLVAGSAFVQALGLLAIAALNAAGNFTPTGLIGLMCVHQICGQSAGVAWSSWYADVVPAQRRGAWFAMRTRFVQLAAFVGLLAGGGLLFLLESEGATDGGEPALGFAAVFALAGAARLISAVLLWKSPEPLARPLASRSRFGRFLLTHDGRTVVRLLVGTMLFQAAVYVASPFFTPFMLEGIELNYAEFTTALAAVVVTKFVTLPVWGRCIDRFGARQTWCVALLLAAAVPIPWLVVGGPAGCWMAQAFSGLAWGGHEVASISLLIGSTRRSVRPQVLVAQSMANAGVQFGGSMLGAAVVGAHAFTTAFAASAVGRLVVAAGLVFAVRGVRRRDRTPVVLRVAGYRPGAGITHRPVDDPSDANA
ncbi:MAG: MFS transporter [Planctomycetes bacterium]|nr:MFS transporter [Planctomycetota bacterium]